MLETSYAPGGGVDAVKSVAGKTGDVTLDKSDVGLGNVDNTSDANKPVSTAQAAAIADAVAAVDVPVTSVAGKVGDVLLARADVGLGNVDNTSDLNKPIGTATQAALDDKAPIASPALTGNPTAPNQAAGNNSTRLANTAYVETAVAALAALVSGALVFKTAWDASAGTFPGAGVAQTGWFYKVSVAGDVDGVHFSVGDDIFAIADNASTATYVNNWLKIEGSITLAEVEAAVGFAFGTLASQSTLTASQIADASANGRSLVTAANYAAMKGLLAIVVGDVTGAEATANKGAANGYASLGADSKVPAGQLPTFPNAAAPIPAGGTASQVLTKIDATDYNTQWSTISVRKVLLANTTFYVRTDGNDANTGLADNAGGAFLTWQGAYNALLKYDFGGFSATVQVRDGTYTGALNVITPMFGGPVVFQGNAATPANVLLSTTSMTAVYVAGQGHRISFKDFKVATTTSGSAMRAELGAVFNYQNIDFGACAGVHLQTDSASQIRCTGNYAISGGALVHFGGYGGSYMSCRAVTITLTGTPAFANAFCQFLGRSLFDADGITFTGGATGKRYELTEASVVHTNSGGANYFPGNSAGSTATGGQYT